LFVEDDNATREGYAAYLWDHGYDVNASPSGVEALDFAFNCPQWSWWISGWRMSMDGRCSDHRVHRSRPPAWAHQRDARRVRSRRDEALRS